MPSTTIHLSDEEYQRVIDLKYHSKKKRIGYREIFLAGIEIYEKELDAMSK